MAQLLKQHLGGKRRRDADRDGCLTRRRRHGPRDPGRRARQQGQRLGERDRLRGAPGHEARHAGRRDDVRQGHHPAVGGPHRQLGRVPAHDRQVADAGEALDRPDGPHPGRGDRGRRRDDEADRRPLHRRGAQGPRRAVGDGGAAPGGLRMGRSAGSGRAGTGGGRGSAEPDGRGAGRDRHEVGGPRSASGGPLARFRVVMYGSANRKEVMCSDRQ